MMRGRAPWSELDSPISALFQIASSENLPILPEVPPPSNKLPDNHLELWIATSCRANQLLHKKIFSVRHMVYRIGFWREISSLISAFFQMASSESPLFLPDVPPPSQRLSHHLLSDG